ncbi:porin family protein [Geotalea uraniireducens]|uniref:OmpW family protein n=1 Tax=Geotalea uraniireducens (strain Rf4) TaxID=351605 RepID=A5GAN4_GEOUR|nr:porin family protein [Geotalea uraniireducens]ABQ25363.1 OmpW family protein [Geotalea uraniireducens Rf4]
MKKYLVFIVMAAVLCTLSDIAMADSIKGRLGVTGRLGFMVPSGSEFTKVSQYTIIPSFSVAVPETGKGKADTAFAGGGGFIYGITDNFALEADVTHTPNINYVFLGQKSVRITTTNVSLGFQYRFIPESRLVPYLGAGVDFIISDGKYQGRDELDIETLVGDHVNAGVDFFVTKHIALNADIRGVLAPKAEVNNRNLSLPENLKTGEYDPISFVALFGVRFFLY